MNEVTVAAFKVLTFQNEDLIIKTTQIWVFMQKKNPKQNRNAEFWKINGSEFFALSVSII